MRLALFGATGGVGQELLRQASDAGHQVRAVVRRPDQLAVPAVDVVRVDLAAADVRVIADAIRGVDVVLSAIGPGFRADTGIAAHATGLIAEAMQHEGIDRILVISAATVGTVASPDRRRLHGAIPVMIF